MGKQEATSLYHTCQPQRRHLHLSFFSFSFITIARSRCLTLALNLYCISLSIYQNQTRSFSSTPSLYFIINFLVQSIQFVLFLSFFLNSSLGFGFGFPVGSGEVLRPNWASLGRFSML